MLMTPPERTHCRLQKWHTVKRYLRNRSIHSSDIYWTVWRQIWLWLPKIKKCAARHRDKEGTWLPMSWEGQHSGRGERERRREVEGTMGEGWGWYYHCTGQMTVCEWQPAPGGSVCRGKTPSSEVHWGQSQGRKPSRGCRSPDEEPCRNGATQVRMDSLSKGRGLGEEIGSQWGRV